MFLFCLLVAPLGEFCIRSKRKYASDVCVGVGGCPTDILYQLYSTTYFQNYVAGVGVVQSPPLLKSTFLIGVVNSVLTGA